MLQDQYVQVGSVNTCYWSAGGQGIPVLLLHGLGGCKENWRCNIESLAKSHRVSAVDLPGFGLSEKPPVRYSSAYFTQFMCDWMDQMDVARATLIGNSLGGGIALNLTIQHPERVDKLVLVDSGGLGKGITPLLPLSTLPLLGDLLVRPSRWHSRRVRRSCLHNPHLIDEQEVELHYQRSILPGALAALRSATQEFVDLGGVRDSVVRSIVDRLPTIAVPTLIIWGRQDRVLPVSEAQMASERIPHAELMIFEECGHVPQIECADKFNAAVLEFLDE